MEKEQIIKALECCTQEDYNCEKCPYFSNGIGGMGDMEVLMRDALALIEELTEKVEAYRQELGKVRVDLNNANVDNKRLTEENERLKQLNESYAEIEQGYIVTGVKKVQSDTAREFAERLKEKAYIPKPYGVAKVVDEYEIDQTAKEILNENTEEEKK